MILRRIYVIPLGLFVLIPITFLITYTIAVLNEHTEAGFPYISDTGASSPESCIFGQLLNIAAFSLCLFVYVRYLEVKYYPDLSFSNNEINQKLNKVALVFGLLSCLGLDFVANFQATRVIIVHMFGAILCFGGGTLYFLLQVIISRKMSDYVSRRLLIIRAIFVTICIVTIVLTVAGAFVAFILYGGEEENFNVDWDPQDNGWEWHLTSTTSEWILSVTFCLFLLTFVPEFYDLELLNPLLQQREKINKENSETVL